MREDVSKVLENVGKVIIGKEEVLEKLLAGLLAGGHVLLEDVPGTGKTKMAKALSASLGVKFGRIQFTPDMLPADITGMHIYSRETERFEWKEGPVFTNVLLADEINRATPRTQAGLLECMEERQVTVDGETRKMEEPFFVIATQNPVETAGTFSAAGGADRSVHHEAVHGTSRQRRGNPDPGNLGFAIINPLICQP